MVLARLRQETAQLHQSVEARVDLLSPRLTLEQYVRILQVFHAFFSPCEKELDSACPDRWRELWSGRRRAGRLEADLADLGAIPDSSIDCSVSIPSLSGSGKWLGALYVIEGSTLGGQVISRHIEKHFGWSEGRGYSHFQGYGQNTGTRWKEVCSALESSGRECNQIINGAHQIFNQLKVCLEASL